MSSSGTYRADSPGTLGISGIRILERRSDRREPARWTSPGRSPRRAQSRWSGATTLTGNLTGAGATTISGSLTWGPNGAFEGIGHDDHRAWARRSRVTGDDSYCGGCGVDRTVDEDGTLVNEGTIVFPAEAETRYL